VVAAHHIESDLHSGSSGWCFKNKAFGRV